MKKSEKFFINDIIILIVLTALSLSFIFVPKILGKHSGRDISVFKDGNIVETLSIYDNTIYTVPGTEYRIEIKDGTVTVLSSECPDKICEKMSVSSDGGSIICLPSKIVIRLSSHNYTMPYDIVAG